MVFCNYKRLLMTSMPSREKNVQPRVLLRMVLVFVGIG